MRILRLTTVVLTLTLAGTACSDTAGITSVRPAGPRQDGTGMVGSGNRDGSTPADTAGTTSRGTGMVGSGN